MRLELLIVIVFIGIKDFAIRNNKLKMTSLAAGKTLG